MPDIRDPHLRLVREAQRLVVTGTAKREACKILKVGGVRLNKLLQEYQDRRKARTLFEDIDRVSETDIYDHTFQMKMLADRRNKKGLKIGSPSTDNPDG